MAIPLTWVLVPKLFAHYSSLSGVPQNVGHSPPHSIDTHLHSPFITACSTNQLDTVIAGTLRYCVSIYRLDITLVGTVCTTVMYMILLYFLLNITAYNQPSVHMRSEGYSTWSVCVCVCVQSQRRVDISRTKIPVTASLTLGESREAILTARHIQFCRKPCTRTPIAPIATLPGVH